MLYLRPPPSCDDPICAQREVDPSFLIPFFHTPAHRAPIRWSLSIAPDMQPSRAGTKTKAAGRSQPRRKQRTSRAAEEDRDHLCQVCFKSFSSAQALGGHKNAHRRERHQEATPAAPAGGAGWPAGSPPAPPLAHGCLYLVGCPQLLYLPRPPSAGGGAWPVQCSYAGEGASDHHHRHLMPSSSSSGAPEECRPPCTTSAAASSSRGDEKGDGVLPEDLDLTLRL